MLSRVVPSSRPLAQKGVRAFSTKPTGLKDVVIVSSARTPIGSLSGSLSSIAGPQLQAITIKAALERAGVKPELVTEAIIGNVVSANLGQAPARQAAIFGGLLKSTVCTTVNKVCASGMKAVMYGAQSIALGHHEVVIAGGFESMSNVPFYLSGGARTGFKFGHQQLVDGLLRDGLTDVYDGQHMGMAGEDTSTRHGISRKEQDDYAILAYKRAAEATQKGYFKPEIVEVTIPSPKGNTVVTEDEEYKKTVFEKIPTLRPAFKKDGGCITAANASKLNDGACSLLLMSADKAKELGLNPIARIIGYGDAEQEPIQFPTSPSLAIPVALRNAGLSIKDIDYWEINEAFAVVALANSKLLNIPMDRLNVHGGGVSLGHPIGYVQHT